MPTADGRIYKRGNRCGCGKPIGGYASRCKSCNLRHQHATGVRPSKPPPSRGPHTPETRAKMSAAHRGHPVTQRMLAVLVARNKTGRIILDAATVCARYDAGQSCQQIGESFGCSRSVVERTLAQLSRFDTGRGGK